MSYWTYLWFKTPYGAYVLRIEDIVEVYVHDDPESVDQSFILLRHNGKVFVTRDQARDAIRSMTETSPI